MDYSQAILALQKQTKHIHEHLLQGKLEEALNLTDLMQFEVLNLRAYCIHHIKIDVKSE